MNIEKETITIRRIHVVDQGFEWYYEVKDNADFPTEAILITEYQEKKAIGTISINRKAIDVLITCLDECRSDIFM